VSPKSRGRPAGRGRPRRPDRQAATSGDGLSDLVAQARTATAAEQVTALARWVGAGRKLTQTGRLTMADARELVSLLDTGDELDPVVGAKTFRTRSSEDLPELNVILAWAKAAGLVRTQRGRLVPVKKNAVLLDRPLDVWCALFEAFDRVGEVLCPSGWYASLFSVAFPDGVAVLFASLARAGGRITAADACEEVWLALSPRFRLDDLTEARLSDLRGQTEGDVHRAVDKLVSLGALVRDGAHAVSLSALGDWALRRPYTVTEVGKPIAVLRVTLIDSKRPIWRRVLVPADIRLDRLHDVIQAAMGWEDRHLHVFTKGTDRYGELDGDDDFDLGHRDERAVPLKALLGTEGDSLRYEYDFGDGWDHDIVLEGLLAATGDGRYPLCVAGERACPPEDCGGVGGYEELERTLADAEHPDHEHMREWVALPDGVDFDPARFDIAEANARIDSAIRVRRPSN
jgi:Plasmid pRiA4b ORF-3-like protein